MRITCTAILCFFCVFTAQAQSVGLVLSGGGAKGAAHVGVIKALEENNIPIDYITGTSFGAIVGAMYASGYTPDQMAELLRSEKFLSWVYGEIKEDDKFFYKRGEQNPSWFSLNLERNHNPLKTILPSSLFENHQMDLRLMEVLAPPSALANYNFDNLMVPFRCVATDINNSKAKILSSGNLSRAVRASITFPLVFKPIEIDGVLCMDGGMKNNFPSDVMIQNFNPDVLVGSKVAFNSNTPDPDDMFSQLENIFTEYTDFSLPDTTLLIEPKVRNYGASDFELIDTLIELGYAAALKKINVIKKAIPREQKPSDLQTKRDEFRKRLPPLVFNNVIISGLNSKQKQYVKRNIKANRDTFSFAELQKEYFLLLSDNKIREIEPTTTFNPQTGFFDLFLDVKTDYQIQVQLGGQINSTSKNFSFLGVSYKHLGKRAYDVTGSLYYGRMYSSMRLVGSVDFPYFRNRKGKRLFPLFANLAINYSRRDYFNSTKEWFFEDETPSYITQRENYVKFDVGIPFSTNGFFALGSTYGATADHYYQANVVSREDIEDITRFDYFSPSAKVEYSTLNEKQFSTQGKYAKLMVRQVFGREEFLPGTTAGEVGLIKANESHTYQEVELQVRNYHYITDKLKIEGALQAFYSNKKLFSNYLITKLSSDEYTPFPHTILFYLPNFRTHSYFSVGATPLYKFTDRISLRAGAHFYQPYRQIEFNLYKAQLGEPFKEYYIIGNASMVYQTFMGPLYASVSYFDRAYNQWFFHFGFGFLILNPRGLD